MSRIRTSQTHPIRVDFLPTLQDGKVGLTFAPGKHSTSKGGARWERDLADDLDRLVQEFGTAVLVCLLEDHELDWLKIPDLVQEAEARHIEVLRLPIPDAGVLPEQQPVRDLVTSMTDAVAAGKTVVIHCAGGLGRTGTVAGCFMVQHGMTAEDAIVTLHRVRSRNSPETRGQEAFIAQYERDLQRVQPRRASQPGNESPRRTAVRAGIRPRQSQIVGAVLGAAIGDAMGHPTEFIKSFDGIRSKYGPAGVTGYELMWGEGEQSFAPYTDDTQMAEAVLRGLLDGRTSGDDLEGTMKGIAERFVEWAEHPQGGHRAPGNTCLGGCHALAQGTHWSKAGALEKGGGCGSVMRSYPFGLVFAHDLRKAEDWAVAHSLMTHRHAMATSACAAMAIGMARTLRGETTRLVASEMVAAACRHSAKTAGMMARAIDEALGGIEPEVTLQRLLGWRGDQAIAAAVYVFLRHPDDPQGAVLEGANTPGDSDSIATLAGALVGARCGIGAFPDPWVEKLERVEDLRELALSIES